MPRNKIHHTEEEKQEAIKASRRKYIEKHGEAYYERQRTNCLNYYYKKKQEDQANGIVKEKKKAGRPRKNNNPPTPFDFTIE